MPPQPRPPPASINSTVPTQHLLGPLPTGPFLRFEHLPAGSYGRTGDRSPVAVLTRTFKGPLGGITDVPADTSS